VRSGRDFHLLTVSGGWTARSRVVLTMDGTTDLFSDLLKTLFPPNDEMDPYFKMGMD
jgi:hypothetical protein